MFSNIEIPVLENVRLEPHPTARSKAVSRCYLSPGSTIVLIPALSTILLPSEKGRRCDSCHLVQRRDRPLRRCSACAAYWYCSAKCQLFQWKAHHKKICKVYNQFVTSTGYQALAPHERLDAILLSHLVAEVYQASDQVARDDFSTFLSLISHSTPGISAPPMCPIDTPPYVTRSAIDELYSRFGNNNFAIHSHLTSIAHGIFPLASRLFNHSCAPNAAAKYILAPSQAVHMQVIALSPISKGEEICISYVDPALIETRQRIFQLTYGFRCTCTSCVIFEKLGRIPDPPANPVERRHASRMVREHVFPSGVCPDALTRPSSLSIETIPKAIHLILHESFMASISEVFSRASHEGPVDVALEAGVTLLALYVLIYPLNYPQIGMHLLEMAKTAWNAAVVENIGEDRTRQDEEITLLVQAKTYLEASNHILSIFGTEGDEDGPRTEIQMLQKLLPY